MPDKIESPLMKVAEAADYLTVSAETVRRWAREDRLPFHRMGRGLRFKKTDLDRFIATTRQA